MKYVALIVVLTIIVMVQFLNKTRKQIYFVDLNIFLFFSFIILVSVKFFGESMIWATIFIVLNLFIILYLMNYRIRIQNNNIILKKGIFSKNKSVAIADIEKIYITNEFVTDTSQFFINIVLTNGNIEKVLLIFVSPFQFLEQISKINPKADIDIKSMRTTLAKDRAISFSFFIFFLFAILYLLFFYSN